MFRVGWRSPWDAREPHVPQQRFLRAAFRDVDKGKVVYTHFRGGRRSGKSVALILALIESALNHNTGLVHEWSSPTLKDAKRVFYQHWSENVPRRYWTENLSDHIIFFKHPQSGIVTKVYYGGRDSVNTKTAPGRGAEIAFLAFDEGREDRDDTKWKVLLPTVSHPRASKLMVVSGSTPVRGWWESVVNDGLSAGRAEEIVSASFLNPYSQFDSEGYKDQVDAEYYAQEVLGEWVSLGSRIWDNIDLDSQWPNGNRIAYEFDSSRPFVVSCDLGVRSGWIVWQTVYNPSGIGQRNQYVQVAVAEYTPNDGDTQRIVQEITSQYGRPSKVIVGSDLFTRAITDSRTSAMIFQDLGWNCEIVPIKGFFADKQMQYLATRRCIENANGYRSICISNTLKTWYPNHRGLVDLFRLDEWPSKAPRSGEFLPKDKYGSGVGLEDIRDALLYFVAATHPLRGDGAGAFRRGMVG